MLFDSLIKLLNEPTYPQSDKLIELDSIIPFNQTYQFNLPTNTRIALSTDKYFLIQAKPTIETSSCGILSLKNSVYTESVSDHNLNIIAYPIQNSPIKRIHWLEPIYDDALIFPISSCLKNPDILKKLSQIKNPHFPPEIQNYFIL